jgi:hypothetical protein
VQQAQAQQQNRQDYFGEPATTEQPSTKGPDLVVFCDPCFKFFFQINFTAFNFTSIIIFLLLLVYNLFCMKMTDSLTYLL